MPETKACTICGEVKPRTEFYARTKTGWLSGGCKECTREQRRQYRAAHPDRISEANKRNRAKHVDERSAANKAWRDANPDKTSAAYLRRRAKDPGAAARTSKAWREANPERERAGQRRWYEANKAYASEKERERRERLGRETIRAAHTAWRKARPEVWSALIHKRRARKRGQDLGDVSATAVAALFEAFRDTCAYCPAPATTLDHYIPLKLGGLHAVDNLAPACRSCNASKGAKHPEQWIYSQQEATCPAIQ